MTDEQIKKDAERYASVYYHPYDSENNPQYLIVSEDSFIAGAHSRDEEIGKLKKLYEEALHKYYEAECKLRNPWISVEDRLPGIGERVFVRYGDVIHSLYSSAYMLEKDLWSIEGYGNGSITHWMAIPELKK